MKKSVLKSDIEVISPEKAKEILGGNYTNRKLRSLHVDYFCELIKKNEFIQTHQGICLDDKGRLLDGQHRLTAVVKSGKTVNMLVTVVKEKDANDVYGAIDCGICRTITDLTGIEMHIAAVMRLFLVMIYNKKIKFSPQDVAEIYRVLSYESHIVSFLITRKNKVTRKSPVVAAAICAYLLDGEVALDFFKKIQDEDFGGKGCPVSAAWKVLMTENCNSTSEKIVMFEKISNCYLSYATNKKIQKVYSNAESTKKMMSALEEKLTNKP